MSKFKRALSAFLAIAIVFGMFSCLAPIAAPVASAAEGTSKIQSYADLVAEYGQNGDGFVYSGLEFYEADGKLTDYYVNAGDELTARVYIKSNLYVGESYILTFYDNSFFDIKLAGGPNASLDENTGYTSNDDKAPINSEHPIVISNKAKHILTTIAATNAGGWTTSVCGFTKDYLSTVDMVQSNTETDTSKSTKAYDMKSDLWLFEYYVKVKTGLADGTTGIIESPEALWHAAINTKTGNHDSRRKSYIPVISSEDYAAGITDLTATTTMAAAMDSGVIDHFVKDHDHEFTIGANPNAGGSSGEVTKYTATFYDADETVIKTAENLLDGAEVEFPAAVDNQIGWAVVGNGKSGEIVTDYTIDGANVEFLRVLSTSKFPVDIVLDENAEEITVDEEKLEAAGAEYIAEKAAIRVMLSIGETFDLATIEDAFSKAGNEFAGWDVEETAFTLETANGALGSKPALAPKAEWEPNIYTINFYLDKESVGTADPVSTKEVKYNETASYGAITNAISDKKFAGWYNAADDSFISEKNSYAFTITEDINVYAKWSDYKNAATFMVRDYVNGEWVEYSKLIDKKDAESVTVSADKVKEILTSACADANTTLQGVYTENPDENAGSKVNGILQLAPGVYQAAALTYSGQQTYYIATTIACEVTWTVPAYDAETDTFDEANATVIATDKVATAAYATDSANPYEAVSKLNKTITIPTGYELAYWKDAATGEKVELNENGAYAVDANTRTATLIAAFELVEYTVAFNLRNSNSPDIIMMTATVSLGDEIEIDGAEFTLNGEATVLPEIGLDNADQADGGYVLPEGYKFAGWSFSADSNAEAIEFPEELTADIIKRYYANGVININAMWDAEEFTLTFYITNAQGEEEVFDTKQVKVGSDIASYRTVTAEISAAINAKAPEGKSFSNVWYNKETDAPDTSTNMPAKDVAYYATYNDSTIRVYIDYNNLAEKNLEETMKVFRVDGKEILRFGADITEVKEEAPYYSRSFETVVTRSNVNEPEEPSEIIAWNIYHVAAGEDPYTAEWKPGVNDTEGSTIAETTLIFQPKWMAIKDMWLRFHDTDDKIYFAVGKDFSLHYWNDGVVVEKYSDTVVNTNPEDNIVLFYTISADWQNFSFRFDAFPIPKYIFTPEGFVAFFEMIPTLIKSLLG